LIAWNRWITWKHARGTRKFSHKTLVFEEQISENFWATKHQQFLIDGTSSVWNAS